VPPTSRSINITCSLFFDRLRMRAEKKSQTIRTIYRFAVAVPTTYASYGRQWNKWRTWVTYAFEYNRVTMAAKRVLPMNFVRVLRLRSHDSVDVPGCRSYNTHPFGRHRSCGQREVDQLVRIRTFWYSSSRASARKRVKQCRLRDAHTTLERPSERVMGGCCALV
jgi:hypothetical protein